MKRAVVGVVTVHGAYVHAEVVDGALVGGRGYLSTASLRQKR